MSSVGKKKSPSFLCYLKKKNLKILQGEANCCFIHALVHKRSVRVYLFLGHLGKLACKKNQHHFSCKKLKIRYFYGFFLC